jgi:CRISPR-associated Cas5-like protein
VRLAFYPVSVRRYKFLPTASFRFPITWDTLALGYEIPVISALLGLVAFSATHLLGSLHARHTNNKTSTMFL